MGEVYTRRRIAGACSTEYACSMLLLLMTLLACDDDGEALEPATVTFLVPTEGEAYPTGDLQISLVVENFNLVSPEHNEGEAEGYVEVTLDNGEPLQTASTTPSVSLDEAGEHTLSAVLFYTDGDAVEPEASATVSFTAE
jgi:hypothetical protein